MICCPTARSPGPGCTTTSQADPPSAKVAPSVRCQLATVALEIKTVTIPKRLVDAHPRLTPLPRLHLSGANWRPWLLTYKNCHYPRQVGCTTTSQTDPKSKRFLVLPPLSSRRSMVRCPWLCAPHVVSSPLSSRRSMVRCPWLCAHQVVSTPLSSRRSMVCLFHCLTSS